MPVDMKVSASERKGAERIASSEEEYPWGLRLHLDDPSLKKLNMESLPAVGDEFMVIAKAKVNSISENESEGEDKSRHLSLQIVEMDLASYSDDDENGEKRINRLYGDKT